MTGDQDDIARRLRSLLPSSWFGGGPTPILDALLQGPAWALSFFYSLYAYAKLQTRVATATDGWLDLIAADFFGAKLPRKVGEADGPYRVRILANLFREKATRQAVIGILEALTGATPIVVEPQRPLDTGAYNTNLTGYGVGGAYGSLDLAYQAFVTAYLPATSGIPYVGGYGASVGAYNTASQLEYASLSYLTGSVTVDDIYAAVEAVRPAGTIIWVTIPGHSPTPDEPDAPGSSVIGTESGSVLGDEAGNLIGF